ncbi:protein kinase-1 [Alphabaculovirus myunipunctae]|uniref:non-specific serine/threonine protein kinase n=1 Tax=Mythimna unipuncta nucleopolyhedrovirus TaxID=447897 RepID=A0A2K9VS24_9ABAC|nr:protein kinase-1 [Mythimna unipuncta nucleopolyhedrovirus]AUV65262.1 protein kinase-1 [Mythimna unipuncta nucleopolyhedrovirus]
MSSAPQDASSVVAVVDPALAEINDFCAGLKLERSIKVSDGKFGRVSVWRHVPTQYLFLKKTIKLKHYNEVEPMIHSLMSNHKYFIKLYYSVTTLKSHVLIMDYVKGGDLFELLKTEDHLSTTEAKLIVRQLCEGLHALHSHHIIHNDIKLENILYNRYKHIKIADYGLCKIVGQESCYDGTIDYFSPEKINHHRYDFHFDWWAVGVLTYELLCGEGEHPFKKECNEVLTVDKLAGRQQQQKLHFNRNNFNKDAQTFIVNMLKYNINYRLHKYSEIIKYDFLNYSLAYSFRPLHAYKFLA